MFPPSILRIRRWQAARRRRGLWLPLVLVWPLAAALWLVCLPIILVVTLIRSPRRVGRALLFGPRLFAAFCATRGLHVEVRQDDREFLLSIR